MNRSTNTDVLDAPEVSTKRSKPLHTALYVFAVLCLTAIIWSLMYSAQFLEYDLNYGQLIQAFMWSVGMLVTGLILIIRKNKLASENMVFTIIFMLVDSPLAVLLAAGNYEFVFGGPLQH